MTGVWIITTHTEALIFPDAAAPQNWVIVYRPASTFFTFTSQNADKIQLRGRNVVSGRWKISE